MSTPRLVLRRVARAVPSARPQTAVAGLLMAGLLVTGLLAACAQPVDAPGSPVDGLHACPAAGSLIGVFTGQDPTSAQGDGPAVEGSDTWGLTVGGTARRVTDDGGHTGAVISPDGLTIYQLRSSGRLVGDSMEAASVIEQRD